jgi:hypothetical protein
MSRLISPGAAVEVLGRSIRSKEEVKRTSGVAHKRRDETLKHQRSWWLTLFFGDWGDMDWRQGFDGPYFFCMQRESHA